MSTDLQQHTINSITRIVDELKSFVASPDQTNDPQIAALVSQYSAICRGVNERLTRCAGFLQEGRRGEAIQEAEIKPDLITTADLLRFDGLDQLLEVAANYGWDRPEVLKSDVISMLGHAYQLEDNLKDVLPRYREMCLARSPLVERLDMLRQIAELDSTTSFWREDIETFERRLMQDMEEMLDTSGGNGSAKVIADVVRIYDTQPWTIPPTAGLANRLQTLLPKAYEATLFPRKIQEFEAAFQQRNIPALKNIEGELRSMQVRVRQFDPAWQMNAALANRINPIVNQLRVHEQNTRQREFNAEIHNLRAMFSRKPPKQELEAAVEKLKSYGLPIPPQLMGEVEAYFSNQRDDKIMRNIVLITASIGFIGIVVFVFFMVFVFAK